MRNCKLTWQKCPSYSSQPSGKMINSEVRRMSWDGIIAIVRAEPAAEVLQSTGKRTHRKAPRIDRIVLHHFRARDVLGQTSRSPKMRCGRHVDARLLSKADHALTISAVHAAFCIVLHSACMLYLQSASNSTSSDQLTDCLTGLTDWLGPASTCQRLQSCSSILDHESL